MTGARTRARRFAWLPGAFEAQRGTLLLWLPFGLALGIGSYFALDQEPGLTAYSLVMAAAAGLALVLRRYSRDFVALSVFILMAALGFVLSGLGAHRLAAPVLQYRFYGAVQGRIIAIDRSSSNWPRITLDQVVMERMPAGRTPAKVRISLHYPQPFVRPAPGLRVMLTASLSPPQGPAEPGGFDFQRFAWFRQLGAVGYARTPMLEIMPPDRAGWRMAVFRARMQLAAGLKARLNGQKGAFAAAILTGDRSAVQPAVLQSLRASNLAHLLAISGLHMGLLTGFVFAAVRYGLALVPRLALRLPGKKIAAVCAFLSAIMYLVLSGGNVATQRAFVMVAVMLLAVLLDRRALTLRAVALAAVIVLLLRPESLIEAGFQMSFVATSALVAVFAALREGAVLAPTRGRGRKFLRGLATLVISSAVAGIATAPVSAFHFNQIAQFGLLANLASVPVMGFVIMPAAVIGIVLLPFGLDGLAWMVMGAGIDWILLVAAWVASLDQAVTHIAKPVNWVLPLIACGFLGLVVLRGRVRLAGMVPMLAGFLVWNMGARPDLLLSANGRVLGLLGAEGRVINRTRGNGFVIESWLENDGDGATQSVAARRSGLLTRQKTTMLAVQGVSIAYRWDKSLDIAGLGDLCAGNDAVIAPQYVGRTPPDCLLVDKARLRALGSVAFAIGKTAIAIKGARQVTGVRLWSR